MLIETISHIYLSYLQSLLGQSEEYRRRHPVFNVFQARVADLDGVDPDPDPAVKDSNLENIRNRPNFDIIFHNINDPKEKKDRIQMRSKDIPDI